MIDISNWDVASSERKTFVFWFQLHWSLLLRSTLEYVTIDLGQDLEPNI